MLHLALSRLYPHPTEQWLTACNTHSAQSLTLGWTLGTGRLHTSLPRWVGQSRDRGTSVTWWQGPELRVMAVNCSDARDVTSDEKRQGVSESPISAKQRFTGKWIKLQIIFANPGSLLEACEALKHSQTARTFACRAWLLLARLYLTVGRLWLGPGQATGAAWIL